MDLSNKRDILTFAETDEEKAKVKLILNEQFPNKNLEVPDPYYGEYGFENVFKMLDSVCDVIIKKYNK